MQTPRFRIVSVGLFIPVWLASTTLADVLDLRARVEGTISGEQHLETAGPTTSGTLSLGHEWAGGTRLDGSGHPIARSAIDDAGHAAALADAFPSSPGNNDTAAYCRQLSSRTAPRTRASTSATGTTRCRWGRCNQDNR